jgi:tetratricopeptide (TPR) repeat protein
MDVFFSEPYAPALQETRMPIRSLYILSLSFAPILVGCAMDPVSPEGRRALDASLAAYERGDDQAAIAQADQVLSESHKGPTAMQAFYLRGLSRYRLGKTDAARSDLETVYANTRSDDLKAKAADVLGELAYQRGDLKQAETYFRDVLATVDSNLTPADHAHFRLGVILQRRGQWTEADVHFQRVMYYFKGTELARQAAARAGGRKWTIQVGSFADKANAEQNAHAFQERDMTTFIEPVIRDGRLVYVLQVGRWQRDEGAEHLLPAVRELKSDAFIHVTR